MILSVKLALRYLRHQRGSMAAILGVSLGVASLCVLLGVFEGSEHAFAVVFRGADGDLDVRIPGVIMRNTEERLAMFSSMEGVRTVTPRLEWPVLIRMRGAFTSAMMIGVDPGREVDAGWLTRFVGEDAMRAFVQSTSGKVAILGAGILKGEDAEEQGVDIFAHMYSADSIPDSARSPQAGRHRHAHCTVVGMLETGHQDIDDHVVIVPLAMAQHLTALDRYEGVHKFGLHLEAAQDQMAIKKKVISLLARETDPWLVTTWQENRKSLLWAVSLLKSIHQMLLFIVTVVASFTIVSLLGMMVASRRHEIGILRSFGASRKQIFSIYCLYGALLGCVGIVMGVVLGGWILHHLDWLQGLARDLTGEDLFPAEAFYFVSQMPVLLRPSQVAWIFACTLAACIMASLTPALRASRISPVESLQFD